MFSRILYSLVQGNSKSYGACKQVRTILCSSHIFDTIVVKELDKAKCEVRFSDLQA